MKTVWYCPKCGDGTLYAPCPKYCPSHKEVTASKFTMTYVQDGEGGIIDPEANGGWIYR